jgi:hypothetical protein
MVEILRRPEEIDFEEFGQLAIEHLLGPGMAKDDHHAAQWCRRPDYSRADPIQKSSKEIIVLVGLQSSGKSSSYRTHFAATDAVVSKDRLRNNRRPQRRQMQFVEQALKEGRSVAVDNTNPTVEDRAAIVELARRGYAPRARRATSALRAHTGSGRGLAPAPGPGRHSHCL